MAKRKIPLVEGEIYHISSKSIAGFKIFRNRFEYERMRNLLRYYKIGNPPFRFSTFEVIRKKDKFYQKHLSNLKDSIEILTYCLMPTHLHLILKQLKPESISSFMNKILNSYSRWFNLKNKRKGPLWESRFKNVWIETDEQLLHLTRYIHLNPVTAHLTDKPQNWEFSSYKEFLNEVSVEEKICNYSKILNIKPKTYEKFVNSQINYQRKLAKIKKMFLD